jgi:Flp pilus assembly pilin Flp
LPRILLFGFINEKWVVLKVQAWATGENENMGVKRITRSGQMKAIVKRFGHAATAIEYGLIAAGISVVIIAILQALGANALK